MQRVSSGWAELQVQPAAPEVPMGREPVQATQAEQVHAPRARGCPKFGLAALHAATSSGATCGSGFVARRGCGLPCMIGRMQSAAMPLPAFALPRSNPACWQAVMICPQGPARRGACASARDAPKTTTAQTAPIRNPYRCMLDTPRFALPCDSARRGREEGKAKAASARPAMMSPSVGSNERAPKSVHPAEETP